LKNRQKPKNFSKGPESEPGKRRGKETKKGGLQVDSDRPKPERKRATLKGGSHPTPQGTEFSQERG